MHYTNAFVLLMKSAAEGSGYDLALVVPSDTCTPIPTGKPPSSYAWSCWHLENYEDVRTIRIEVKSSLAIHALEWTKRSSGDVFIISSPVYPCWIFALPRNRINNLLFAQGGTSVHHGELLPYAVHKDDITDLLQQMVSLSGNADEIVNPTSGCTVKMWSHHKDLENTRVRKNDGNKELSATAILQLYSWFSSANSPNEELDFRQVESQPMGGDFVLIVGAMELIVEHKAILISSKYSTKPEWFDSKASCFHILLAQQDSSLTVWNRNGTKEGVFDMSLGKTTASQFVIFLKKNCQKWCQELYRGMSQSFTSLPLGQAQDESTHVRSAPVTKHGELYPADDCDPPSTALKRILINSQYDMPPGSENKRVQYYRLPFAQYNQHPWGSGIVLLRCGKAHDECDLLQLVKENPETPCIIVRLQVRHSILTLEQKRKSYNQRGLQRLRPVALGATSELGRFPAWNAQDADESPHISTWPSALRYYGDVPSGSSDARRHSSYSRPVPSPYTRKPYMCIGFDSVPSSCDLKPALMLLPSATATHVSQETEEVWDKRDDQAKTQAATWDDTVSVAPVVSKRSGVFSKDNTGLTRYWLPSNDVAAHLHKMLAKPEERMSICRADYASVYPPDDFLPSEHMATVCEVLQAVLDYGTSRWK